MKKHLNRSTPISILLNIVLIINVIIVLYPVLFTISSSFTLTNSLGATSVIPFTEEEIYAIAEKKAEKIREQIMEEARKKVELLKQAKGQK